MLEACNRRATQSAGRLANPKPQSVSVRGINTGVIALLFLIVTLVSCSQNGRNPSSDDTIEVSFLEVDLSVFNLRGEPTTLDVDLTRLVKNALGKRSILQLTRKGGRNGGARLRVSTRLSPDGGAKKLHLRMSGKIDRTNHVHLSWIIAHSHALADIEADAISAEDASSYLEKAVDELLEALDKQARVASMSPSEALGVLRNGSPPEKQVAASILKGIKNNAAPPALCKALQLSTGTVAETIIESLEFQSTKQTVSCVASWAGNNPERLGRAVSTATKIADTEALTFLEDVSNNEKASTHVKSMAKAGIRRIKQLEFLNKRATSPDHDHEGEQREDPLIKALNHDDVAVRVGAARALARARRDDAVEPLCRLLDHEDAETVDAALNALARIQSPRAIPCLLRWSSENEQRTILIINVLSMIDGSDSHRVLEILSRDHDSALIRDLAKQSLVRSTTRERNRGR